MKTIMDFFVEVWRYPYLWHVVVCCVVALKMCFLQYKGVVLRENYLHVVVYAITGLIAGAVAYVGVTDHEVDLVVVFGISFSVFVVLSDNPPITILAIGVGYMIACSCAAVSMLPITIYAVVIFIGRLLTLPVRYRIRVSQRVVA